MTATSRPSFPWLLSLLAVVLLGILLSLGVWQVQRLTWKEGLIRSAEAADKAPVLPLSEALKLEDPEFRKVLITCAGLARASYVELRSIEAGQTGVRLVSLCHEVSGSTLLVDRGFMAEGMTARPVIKTDDTMPVVLTAVLRHVPSPSSMTPQPEGLSFYGRDLPAMAKALGAEGPILPYGVYATTSINPEIEGMISSAPPVAFSNNHLGYALTWFGLAIALIVFYAVLLRRRLKRKDN